MIGASLIAILRANAEEALDRHALRVDFQPAAHVRLEQQSRDAIGAVAEALDKLALAETMLTVFGVEGEKLEMIRAAIKRVDGVA